MANITISQMKDYLRFATEFEKQVYFWSSSMNEFNRQKSDLYNTRNSLQAELNSNEEQLILIDRQKSLGTPKERSAKSKSRTFLLLTLIMAAVTAIAILGFSMDYFSVKHILLAILALAVCLVCWIYQSMSAVNSKASGSVHLDRQKELIKLKTESLKDSMLDVSLKETLVNNQQENIQRELMMARKNRDELYSKNILHPDFRNLAAVSTMYEYLVSGVCNTIAGHGGIFDTYRREKILLEQLEQQMRTNRHLEDIKNNQRLMVKELQGINRKLDYMRSSLSNIERTNNEIARNTAECAQSAREWREWRQRHYW